MPDPAPSKPIISSRSLTFASERGSITIQPQEDQTVVCLGDEIVLLIEPEDLPTFIECLQLRLEDITGKSGPAT